MYIAQIVIVIYTIIPMHKKYMLYKYILKTKYRWHEMQNLEVKIKKSYWL